MQTISGPAAIVTAMKECPGLKPRQTFTCRNDLYLNPEENFETIKSQIVNDVLRDVNPETAELFEEACEEQRHEIIKYLSLRSVNEQQITALFLKLRNRPEIVLNDLDRILGGGVFFDDQQKNINELGRRLMRMLMVGGHHPETIVASLFEGERNRKRPQTTNAMTRTFGQYFGTPRSPDNHEVGDVWWYGGEVGTGPMVVRGSPELVRARLESRDNDVAYKISRVVAATYQKTRSEATYQSHRNEQSYFGELDHEDLLNNNNYGSFFNHIRPVPHQVMPPRPAPHNLNKNKAIDMAVGVVTAGDDNEFVKNKQRVMSAISNEGSKIPKGSFEKKSAETETETSTSTTVDAAKEKKEETTTVVEAGNVGVMSVVALVLVIVVLGTIM